MGLEQMPKPLLPDLADLLKDPIKVLHQHHDRAVPVNGASNLSLKALSVEVTELISALIGFETRSDLGEQMPVGNNPPRVLGQPRHLHLCSVIDEIANPVIREGEQVGFPGAARPDEQGVVPAHGSGGVNHPVEDPIQQVVAGDEDLLE
ncbi:MAG: hypothetical protein V9G19_01190 [Tetrasphaera sp.]